MRKLSLSSLILFGLMINTSAGANPSAVCGKWEAIDGVQGTILYKSNNTFEMQPTGARSLTGTYKLDTKMGLIDLIADVSAFGKTTVQYRMVAASKAQAELLVERYMKTGSEQRFKRIQPCK